MTYGKYTLTLDGVNRLRCVAERTGVLLESDVDANPLEQFRRWFAEAEAAGIRAPHAMALASAAADGAPSVRMGAIAMERLSERTRSALNHYSPTRTSKKPLSSAFTWENARVL